MRQFPTTYCLSALLPVLLAACTDNPPGDRRDATPAPAGSAAPASATTPAEVTTPAPAADAAIPAFVDKVWRVDSAGGPVEQGSTYSFLGGGTLVETAPHATPMTGQWRYEGGQLTMTEEGVRYPADIVLLDASHFTFRSHNPGGTVEVVTTLATDVPLPEAR